MPIMRKLVQIQLSTSTTLVSLNLREGRFHFGFPCVRRGGLQVEEMSLTVTLQDPFTSAAVDPAFQSLQFRDRRLMCFLQRRVGGLGFIQHTIQFGNLLLGGSHLLLSLRDSLLQPHRLLKSSQQQTLAFGKIVRQGVALIHDLRVVLFFSPG